MLATFGDLRRLFLAMAILMSALVTVGEAQAAPCLTLEAYGGSGDGVTDNTAAWAAALSAIGTANGCIALGAGTYKSTTQVSVSMSAATAQSISINGAGPRTTVLYFPNPTDGLIISMPTPQNGVNLSNFSIATGQMGGRTALFINSPCFGGQSPGVANFGTGPQHLIDNVDLRGFDSLAASDGVGNQYWAYGIIINNASAFYMRAITMYGPRFPAGTGILVQGSGPSGSSDNCASAIFNVSQGNFQRLATAFQYGTAAQGVNIAQSNFVYNVTDIACPPTSKNNYQLTVSGSEFDNGLFTPNNGSIVLGCNLHDVMITGNLFYVQGATNSIILGGASSRFAITGNNFSQQGAHSGNAINVLGAAIHGIISANNFDDLSTGVLLGSSATNWNVQSNQYNGVATPVTNLGSGNTIGGGTP